MGAKVRETDNRGSVIVPPAFYPLAPTFNLFSHFNRLFLPKLIIVKKCVIIAVWVCGCVFISTAQDISGFWKGALTMTGGCFPVNNIEIQVGPRGEILAGDSYHYLDINNYIKKNMKGSFDQSTGKLTLQELVVTTYHIPQRCVICIKKYELYYSKNGDVETLSGTWSGYIMNTNGNCGTGTITLTRIKESAFKEIPEIKVDTGKIKLEFYDNAVVDGDIISVVVNNQVVLSGQKLTVKPIVHYLQVDPQNNFYEVEMVAENLGDIPPNTALLVVTAGDQKYKLFLSSTEQKSAYVRFVYEPELTVKAKKPQ